MTQTPYGANEPNPDNKNNEVVGENKDSDNTNIPVGNGSNSNQPAYPASPPANIPATPPVEPNQTQNHYSNSPDFTKNAPPVNSPYAVQPPQFQHQQDQNYYGGQPNYQTPAPAQNPYSVPVGYNNPGQNSGGNDTLTEMKKPKNLSVIYGGLSILMLLLSFATGFTWIASLVLSPLAIIEAKKAKRQGENATLGLILGWVGIGLIAATIILILLFIAIIGVAFLSI